MRSLSAATLLLVFLPGSAVPQSSQQKYFLGFDRNDYPGDAAMKLLHKDFSFTSYWLGNPPQTKFNSWSGKREFLHSLGYGFLPLFSGPESKELRNTNSVMNRVSDDIKAVIAAAHREGFPSGTIIYLDIE